ncbi:MAG TPA: AAA domain-containing protein, partial [Thermoanaerobaculia bacterium]|nr:AAA domain-containing protein [Thermoanaerobaculia bacterium]
GVPHTSLRWHYRSTHESLITFSNVSFYDGGLFTFPSTETDSHARGVQFEYVEDGVYEGKGVNLTEARRVADAVMRHARETPDLSLGVGTFSLRQQLAIQDELEARRRQDPSAEGFFAPKEEGGFFVKNLENIQGDERDVIFLSVTYGRGPDGKIRHHFGPINGENGWRRLNVLTTRARRHMRVFSSMRGDEINSAQTTSRGAKLLHEFLLYAEHGRLEVPMEAAAGSDDERLLEKDVHNELTRHGIRLQPRVGMAGYRIDFGVLDDAAPGRFLCGIECDGPAYRDAETVRDRDRLRHEVLEARGWTLLRVWSTDWFKDRPGQVDRLLRQIEEARQRAALIPAPSPMIEMEDVRAGLSLARDGASPSPTSENSSPQARLPFPQYPPASRYAGLPAESIPPEAYREMIVGVLRQAGSLERSELIKEVRALLGYKRTGSKLEKAIGSVIDDLLARGVLGEGSSGLRLRE